MHTLGRHADQELSQVVFKKLMAKLGVGGPSVDTVLSPPDTQPGRPLRGQVNILGGDHDVDIDYVALSLVTQAESETGGNEFHGSVEFTKHRVSESFALAAGQELSIPFEIEIPWETPVTAVNGAPLHGMAVGVRTELAVAKAVDKGDMDIVNVHPLASQEAVLEAFQRLGFAFMHADVEHGFIAGAPQQIGFYQEIEFCPPPQYAGRIKEVELSFIATPDSLHVVLEADKRSGGFHGGGEEFGRWHLAHLDAENTDWAELLNGWMSYVAEHAGYGHPGMHPAEHHGHGSGMGGVGMAVAGGAAGFAGGLFAAEAVDEIGDAMFGDED